MRHSSQATDSRLCRGVTLTLNAVQTVSSNPIVLLLGRSISWLDASVLPREFALWTDLGPSSSKRTIVAIYCAAISLAAVRQILPAGVSHHALQSISSFRYPVVTHASPSCHPS